MCGRSNQTLGLAQWPYLLMLPQRPQLSADDLHFHRRDFEISELFYFVFKITEIQMTNFSLTIFRNFLTGIVKKIV